MEIRRIACGLVVLALGCGGSSDPESSAGTKGAANEVSAVAGELVGDGACSDTIGGGGWSNDGIPLSTGAFTIEFTAYPKAVGYPPTIDGVIGLSSGAAVGFTDLGAIVRFNAEGDIDARNGGAYAAATRVQYRSGYPYSFRVTVDVANHTYSAWVKERTQQGTPMTQIASGFAFRSEQQAVTQLDNIGRFIDAAAGSVTVCGVTYSSP